MPASPVRPSRLRRCLAAGLALQLALAGSLPLHAQTAPQPEAPELRLPALGESASDEFNLSNEKRVGEQIMAEIRRDPAYLDDPLLLDYLQSLWQPLVAQARARGDIGPDTATLFPYEAFLVRDRSINAFALPGGYVGVHLGLIAMTAGRDELASVLAHELAHVTRRHIARSVSAQSRHSTLGMAAMLLGLLVAARSSNVDAAQAAVVGGQAAMAQGQLNFSRDMEREADRSGQALMAAAGYAPGGMVSMFDKLDQGGRLNDSGGFPYLRSHPLTVDRIGEARQRVEALSLPLQAPPGSLQHRLMQARARVLMDPSAQALRRWQAGDQAAASAPADAQERIAMLSAAALASSLLRDFDRADTAWQAAWQATQRLANPSASPSASPSAVPPAADLVAARRALQQQAVQQALARGQVPAARQALATLDGDDSRAAVLLRTEVALAENTPDSLRAAADRMQTWVADHRQDATAWQLLAQAAERQGQQLRAVRAQAEAEAALGNTRGAIDRLRAGQQLARRGGAGVDFIEASVIDARLRDLQAQRRALLAEQQANSRNPNRPPPED